MIEIPVWLPSIAFPVISGEAFVRSIPILIPNLNYARKLAENLAFHGFGVPRGD
ncbi:MAG: hypothetical protein GY937_05770 [bacterium]|nr:hypothetical protein [bacterium]